MQYKDNLFNRNYSTLFYKEVQINQCYRPVLIIFQETRAHIICASEAIK